VCIIRVHFVLRSSVLLYVFLQYANAGPASEIDAKCVECDVEGGTVRAYPLTNIFEATCNLARHTGGGQRPCRLTRTSKGSLAPMREFQGRPAGLMAAWLKAGCRQEVVSREDHQNPFLISLISHEDRVIGREAIMATLNGDVLCSCERAPRPGEPTEPEGYWC
jgi:hypothetical protein